jgi:YHS domain-containing protein
MHDLASLEQAIRGKLASAESRRREYRQRLAHQMAEHEARTEQFEKTAQRLIDATIRPRMAMLASLFANARIVPDAESALHHCACRFEHSAEYPASTKLDFGLSPDGSITHAIITYTLEILPVFFQFDGHDQTVVPIGGADEQAVATWIDGKLIAFVDTYLRLQHVEQYQRENVVVDPVCGMSIHRADAGATCEYKGETYYFCVEACRDKFAEAPTRYLAGPK